MRIFVSSTTYDLLDVRAEVESHLRSLGFTPVMSDRRQAEFEVHHDKNSIDTCLINLRSCEAVIVILDKRYGPSLGASGFDDLSATHLEYKTAIEAKLPIHFYVRDRLEADYRLWRQEKDSEKRSALKYSWIQGEGSQRLFDLLHERQKLDATSQRSNWFMSFSDSIQLKEMISRDLSVRAGLIRLEDALRHSRVPTLTSKLRSRSRGRSVIFEFTIQNVGTTPVIDVEWELTKSSEAAFPRHTGSDPWLAPAEGASFQVGIAEEMCEGEGLFEITMRYRCAEGFHIKDTLQVDCAYLRLGSLEYRDQPIDLTNRAFAPATADDRQLFVIVDRFD